MNALILFVSTFVLVFALGLQSLNVNGGHYRAAFFTSFAIGGANMILLKLGPDASALEIAAFLGGGPFGIIISMWFHQRALAWWKAWGARRHHRLPGQRPPKAPPRPGSRCDEHATQHLTDIH